MRHEITNKKRRLEQYDHKGKKQVNNPPVEVVSPETDKDATKKNYQYNPQFNWCGLAKPSIHPLGKSTPNRSFYS